MQLSFLHSKNKNKVSKKKFKKICKGHYELIDITLESPRVLLSMADMGIVGGSKLAQRVSKLIIMVSKDLPGTPDEIELDCFRKMGLNIWEYNDRDVYYIAGSLNDFFNVFVYMVERKFTTSIVDYLFKVICNISYMSENDYGAQILTDMQLNYLHAQGTFSPMEMDKDRMKEMKELIEAKHVIQYELIPVVIMNDDYRKNTLMTLADEYFIGKNRIVLYFSGVKFNIMGDIIPDFDIPDIYNQEQHNDYDPDMVATEVIE